MMLCDPRTRKGRETYVRVRISGRLGDPSRTREVEVEATGSPGLEAPAALARGSSTDHSGPVFDLHFNSRVTESSIPATTAVDADGAEHSTEENIEEVVGDGGSSEHDSPAQASTSSKTVLADEGPRQRTTSTRSFIRVIPRPQRVIQGGQEEQDDEYRDR